MLIPLSACTRSHYRMRADGEAHAVLQGKISGAPWQTPYDFSVVPDARSRFFDPTHPDDPQLPIPAPRLYAYQIPELAHQGPGTVIPASSSPGAALPAASLSEAVDSQSAPGGPDPKNVSSRRSVAAVGYSQPSESIAPATPGAPGLGRASDPPEFQSVEDAADESRYANPVTSELRVPPLPETTWRSLPDRCLRRMFEFASVRSEFERSHGMSPGEERLDTSQRLTFEGILELARINSREYQAQQENLYRVALRLTLERFDYEMKFSPTGHRTTTDYRHDRTGGTTVNNLLVPSQLAGERMLASSGNILARFANDVVLTFNGPSGFATDVGSDLLFDLSQSLIQRDIQFESLTQSERDVVYAARDFARFRKTFFRNLASQYYNLLLSFRGIEIGSQDYFSTTRAFHQGEAEYRAARLPRVQVDQLEQNSLSSRSRLIGTCNSLESDLDNFKLVIGLPTETPINLDLTELENLTLRDESAVLAERVRRAQRGLIMEREQAEPDQGVLINGGLALSERMIDFARLQTRLGNSTWNPDAYDRIRRRLLVTEARLLVEFNRAAMEQARNAQPPAPPLRVYQRTVDLIDSLMTLCQSQLNVLVERGELAAQVGSRSGDLRGIGLELDALRAALDVAAAEKAVDRIPQLVTDADRLLAKVEALATAVNELSESVAPTPADAMAGTRASVDELLASSREMLKDLVGGLAPVDIEMDDAMLTALSWRYDLMNERGRLADSWRHIKLAGDDLRSVLNLRATQTIRTRADVNRILDFTWDESNSRVSLTFDTPLNRKSQRNLFRGALIDYQRSIRSLMAFEDNVKLQIRDDLRQLDLNREQYHIAVASAALAFERVTSTRLQLQLGIQDVAARDFLEAQQAYTASLSSVASVHIRFLLGRIQFFLDSELMVLDEEGFWAGLHDETFQPEPQFSLPPGAGRPYGDLPPGVWYSPEMRRMLAVPDGDATIETRLPPAAEDVAPGMPDQ